MTSWGKERYGKKLLEPKQGIAYDMGKVKLARKKEV